MLVVESEENSRDLNGYEHDIEVVYIEYDYRKNRIGV